MYLFLCLSLILGLLFSSPARSESVLIGLDDQYVQDGVNWQDGMIQEQSFEVTLSEFPNSVWFVSYMPKASENDVRLVILQNGQLLEELDNYVPEGLQGVRFTSLDAVSFVDYNRDGNTDIFIVKTWESTAVSAVYDGREEEGGHHFFLNQELSNALTRELTVHTIANMITYYEENGLAKTSVFIDEIPDHYYFASGVGAWGSEIELKKDGTFTGHFRDSDMGGSGEGYESTVYNCDCTGRFEDVVKHGDFYYSMTLANYVPSQEKGTSWISEETSGEIPYRRMNIITDPRGIYPGSTFYLFLPGAPVSELPVKLYEPMIGVALSKTDPKTLLNFVLYNVDQGAAFSGGFY